MTFNTNISVKEIRIDGLTAYITVKFLSPTPSAENKGYRFYTEYVDKNRFIWTDQVRYWIDTYSQHDSDFSENVSIRRNKEVVLKFDLTQGELIENRFVLNIKLHFKKELTGTHNDKTVWKSDTLSLSSRMFATPDVSCLHVNNIENKLKGKFKLKHKSSADKTIIENNAIFYVDIYSPNQLMKREKVDLITSENNDTDYIEFETIASEEYNERVSKVSLVILLGGNKTFLTKTFVLDTLKNFSARIAEPFGFIKILKMSVRMSDSNKKIKNIFKKY